MPLTLLTLNIEGDRHLDRVCAVIAQERPHIACLQEVFEADCARLAAVGGYQVRHALAAHKRVTPQAVTVRDWGIAVLTRIPVRHQFITCYSADDVVRVFEQPNDPRRLLVGSELDHEGESYRIVTTHFTWSPDGQSIQEQHEDFGRLRQAVAAYDHYALCGDFNAPRGRDLFARFTDELGLRDHLPPEVTTTIDPQLHRAGPLQLAVDTIFATPGYQLDAVRVLEGVSDHKAIVATVRRGRNGG